MKLLTIILAFGMVGCHSNKKMNKAPVQDIEATYQKYLPGEGGGKGIIFTIRFTSKQENLEITALSINGQTLKPVMVPGENGFKLEASHFYADPDRDPDAKGSRDEFEKAPLFNTQSYTAVIQYNYDDQSGNFTIEDFQELEMLIYP